jgi:hypothetical protein
MTERLINFEALLDAVREEVVESVVARLNTFDEPTEKLEAIRAIAALASERDRTQMTATTPLGPDTMIGSYFRAPDQNDPSAENAWLDGDSCKTIKGMVVAQPFTGGLDKATYLVEFYGDNGPTGAQQLVELDRMVQQRWTFYDTDAWLNAPEPAVTVPDDEADEQE